MSRPFEDSTAEQLLELISEQGFAGMGQAIQILMNEAMKIERSRYLKAEPYERHAERLDYANGYKPKRVRTRVGELNLQVPQVRNCDFYPSSLERGLRSEKALRLAVAEMYIQGVSTRRVADITKLLCGSEISSTEVSRSAQLLDEELAKWRTRPLGRYCYLIFDALYEKTRFDGCVVDAAVLIAYGIDREGKREILGVSVSLSEQEVHWRSFMESLISRGLHGVEMITSDAHPGLKAAKRAVFPSVPWQRCQFHLQQNASAQISKKVRKAEVAADIKAVFNAPNRIEADRLLGMAVQKYKDSESKLATWMEENVPESLTIFSRPTEHHKKLRTSNMAERNNKEIRRRTKVVGIFPNEASCLRLITAILVENNEEWYNGKNYLKQQH